MELVFQQQVIEIKKSTSTYDVIERINELLVGNYYFSHFVADGTEVYEDHEHYLNAHLGQIEKIEVFAKTEKEFVNDVLLSTEDYLKRAKPEMAALPDGFYGNPSPEDQMSFSHLMEGLQWLDEMLSVVDTSNERPEEWGTCMESAQTMTEEIVNLSEAVENKDNVLIADIIQYEFIPIFDTLESEVGKIIDAVGIRHDIS